MTNKTTPRYIRSRRSSKNGRNFSKFFLNSSKVVNFKYYSGHFLCISSPYSVGVVVIVVVVEACPVVVAELPTTGVAASDVEVAVAGVEVTVDIVVVTVGVMIGGVEVITDVVSGVEMAASGVEVMVVGVEVVVAGVVVGVITGVVSWVEVAVSGVEVGDKITVDVVVVVVGIMIGGVEACPVVVAELPTTGVATDGVDVEMSRISEMIFDARCLLSHPATAVTPSCHDS